MKMMTKEIEKALPPLYSTEDIKPSEKKIIVKFFHNSSRWTWYIVEGEKQEDGDYLLFGYVESGMGPDCDGFGYVMLSELQSIRAIERDMHFGMPLMKEVSNLPFKK